MTGEAQEVDFGETGYVKCELKNQLDGIQEELEEEPEKELKEEPVEDLEGDR